MASHGEKWHLPREVEFKLGVDSWRIRDAPSSSAKAISLLRPGEEFVAMSCFGDWLQVDLGSAGIGWIDTKLRSPIGEDLQVITLVPEYHSLETATFDPVPMPPPLKRSRSNQQDLKWLLEELCQRRAKALDARTPIEKVQADLLLQETMGKLDILGLSEEQLLALEGRHPLAEPQSVIQKYVDELVRQDSYLHADFTNPRSESCWLSTFFQSLWHSRVFHTIFEAQVSLLSPAPTGTTLGALQETWELYKNSGAGTVPINALVKAWGKGYGDCAEAMGKLQDASDLGPLADSAALVPVPWTGAPTQGHLWELISGMGVAEHALVALDFTFPPLTSVGMQTLAWSLKPNEDADLGSDFKLVAMICYMENFRHYVVFCRSLSEPGAWIFFNDLPTLGPTRGAQRRFNSWELVAHSCAYFSCCPKMLLYENHAAAQVLLEKHSLPSTGSGSGCRQS